MSETPIGIAFIKDFLPQKEADASVVIENKRNHSAQEVQQYVAVYQQLDAAGIIAHARKFIDVYSGERAPYTQIERLVSDDGIPSAALNILFDQQPVEIQTVPYIKKKNERNVRGYTSEKKKGRYHNTLINAETARGISMVINPDGTENLRYLVGNVTQDGFKTDNGPGWQSTDYTQITPETIELTRQESGRYFLPESKSIKIVKNLTSQKPILKVS